MVRAHGYPDVGVVHDKFNIDRIRAERDETLAKIKAANDALHGKGVKAKGKSAVRRHPRPARRLLREPRRPLALDRGERRRRRLHRHGHQHLRRPDGQAERFDAAGQPIGERQPSAIYSDPDVNPRHYQYHPRRSGSATRATAAPVPATSRSPSSERQRRHDRRQGMDRQEPARLRARASRAASSRTTTRRRRRTRRCATSPTEFPNISEAIKLPEQDARATSARPQTMLGYTNATAPGRPRPSYVRFDANNLPVAGAAPTTGASGPARSC